MFLDFKSDTMKDVLFELDSQIMLGSHLMASPVIISGDRKKKTFFPNDWFYDFYDGTLMNSGGEGFLYLDAPLDRLPLFARAGFITPVQIPPEKLLNLNQMRVLPLELIIPLDSNYRAAGKIYFDDGNSKYNKINVYRYQYC